MNSLNFKKRIFQFPIFFPECKGNNNLLKKYFHVLLCIANFFWHVMDITALLEQAESNCWPGNHTMQMLPVESRSLWNVWHKYEGKPLWSGIRLWNWRFWSIFSILGILVLLLELMNPGLICSGVKFCPWLCLLHLFPCL